MKNATDPTPVTNSDSLKALDLCSGIGGMHLALIASGFETKGVDVDPRAVAIANDNNLHTELCDVFDPEIVETLKKLVPNPDLCHASAPCKGFSQASNGTALHKQFCNSITTRAVDIICQINPPVVG